jgi:hypothetical protein
MVLRLIDFLDLRSAAYVRALIFVHAIEVHITGLIADIRGACRAVALKAADVRNLTPRRVIRDVLAGLDIGAATSAFAGEFSDHVAGLVTASMHWGFSVVSAGFSATDLN